MYPYFVRIVVLCGCVKLLKGAVLFPSNSAYGIFAAIAVPLDLGPNRNVFVSYNFEANYNLPYNNTLQIPPQFGIEDTRRLKSKATKTEEIVPEPETDTASKERNINPTDNVKAAEEKQPDPKAPHSRERRSLLSRRTFYNILKLKLEMHGYNGESCLLRMICETNATEIGDNNGFLGSIIHVIFSPTTSKDEGLPDIYYKAEYDGFHSDCNSYQKKCPNNILDLISTPVHEIMNSLRK